VRGTITVTEQKENRRQSTQVDLIKEWRQSRTHRGSATELNTPEISYHSFYLFV
jgi:hypothetical protein